jgi:hypothetical protein
MRYARSTSLTAFATTVWLMLTLPAGAQGVKRSDPIVLRGAGSTLAIPAYRKWIETYRSVKSEIGLPRDVYADMFMAKNPTRPQRGDLID